MRGAKSFGWPIFPRIWEGWGKSTVLCFLLLAATPSVAKAQVENTVPAAQTAQAPSVTEYHLAPDKLAKAKALYETRVVLYLIGIVFGIVVLWILLNLRVAPLFRNLAESLSRNRFLQALIFVPMFLLLLAVISLPLDIYQHHISRAYGLSVQGWVSWAADWAKGEGIALVISVLAVSILFLIIRRSPQRWWFYFWLITLPFLVFLIFIAPVVLDPLFNKFEPLEQTDPQLVSAIEQVTRRAGLNIPPDRMFEMKASDKVTTYNAYVTGIGATKRVVVWDNTARDMTIPETLFVFGHEMGHYVLDHIYKGLAFAAALMFVGFWVGRKIALAMLSRWGERWHIHSINDIAALPVLMLTLSLLTLIADPISNAFSRHIEHQADIYGLEVTHGLFAHSDQVAAESFQKLGEKSFDYPYPNSLLVFWAEDHPTISERIQFALHYHPWDTPQGPKYVK